MKREVENITVKDVSVLQEHGYELAINDGRTYTNAPLLIENLLKGKYVSTVASCISIPVEDALTYPFFRQIIPSNMKENDPSAFLFIENIAKERNPVMFLFNISLVKSGNLVTKLKDDEIPFELYSALNESLCLTGKHRIIYDNEMDLISKYSKVPISDLKQKLSGAFINECASHYPFLQTAKDETIKDLVSKYKEMENGKSDVKDDFYLENNLEYNLEDMDPFELYI